jgi:single-strand DNA-binding protein
MLNRVVLIGRLVADPDMRFTPNGVCVTTFRIAVDRPYQKKDAEKETDFINIVTWRGLAENCANYLRKGKLCAVDGRLQIRNYENNEGQKVYITEVIAENVRFLEWSGNDNSGDSGTNSSGSGQKSNTSQSGRSGNDPFANEGQQINLSDDDLPF